MAAPTEQQQQTQQPEALPVTTTSSTTEQQQQPSTYTSIKNEAYQILLDGLGAFRNGLVYGSKVRAPHSFVVYALWSSSPWATVFKKIITLTTQHASNLAIAAMLFKIGMHLLRLISNGLNSSKKNLGWHYALMGAIGGYYVWGEPTPVNTQVNMYMMSRVLSGLVFLFFEMRERQESEKKAREQEQLESANSNSSSPSVTEHQVFKTTGDDTSLLTPAEQFIFGPRGYRVFVGVVWATALFLFHHHNKHVQSSLRMSMQYIYKEGDKHGGSLRKLLLGF